ncbi:MAG TPA: YdcH family protein [Alphaproteobacteria bacterium]
MRAPVRPRFWSSGRAGRRAPNRKEEHAMINTAHLDSLIEKHHALQDQIDDEIHRPMPDQVRLTQLKREKLKVKEEIARCQS